MRAFSILVALALWTLPALGQEAEREYKPSDAFTDANSIRPPQQIEGRSNAAVEYFRIWDSLTRAERNELGEAAANVDHEKEKLTKEQRAVCEKYRGYIDSLTRQANATDCEWGVNFEAGWMCLLPHLGYLRGSLRAIRLEAYRCIDDGSYAAAAERVAAMIRMSDQTRTDEIMISSLVGAAICAAGLNVTDEMIKGHMLNPAAARAILSALKAIPKEDLFGSASSIKRERYMSVDWVRGHYTGARAGYLFMREIEGSMGVSGDIFTTCIYGLNEAQFGADLDRFAKYFDAASAAWRGPDNVVKLRELSTEVWEGQYGMIARVMAPSIERVAMSINRERKDIARVTAELEPLVHPEDVQTPVQPSGGRQP